MIPSLLKPTSVMKARSLGKHITYENAISKL